MNTTDPQAGANEVTADLVAEAAAWLAVLHGPNRTQRTERGFAQWLKRSARHERAFEEATSIWEESRNLGRAGFSILPAPQRHPLSFARVALAAAASLLVLAGGWFVYEAGSGGVRTGIGEQRVLVLDDGSRLILNTDTRVVVDYNQTRRRIELKSGEALFEVAREAGRPFVVDVGSRQVRALGTSFTVRREAHSVAVVLVDGKVAVSEAARGQAEVGASLDEQLVLVPGQRVVFTDSRPAEVDRPRLDQVLAWQRREVALDDVSLDRAVAEVNRYSRIPVVIATDSARDVRVTGLFRAGDSLSFARAVAEAYHLDVISRPDQIVLQGEPVLRQP